MAYSRIFATIPLDLFQRAQERQNRDVALVERGVVSIVKRRGLVREQADSNNRTGSKSPFS